MPTRRTLLISGASTIITALLSPRAMTAQRRLKPLKPGSRIRAVNPGTWMDPDTGGTDGRRMLEALLG